MNTLDFIIIAIIAISALNGLIRGLIRTLFGLTALITAVVLTWMFTPGISQLIIEETSFDEMISEKTVELLNIEEMVTVDLETSDAAKLMKDLSLPGNMVDNLIENYTPQIVDGFDFIGIGDYVGGAIAVMSVKALTFVVLFIIISIILNAIVTLLDLVARLPVLKQANRIGGFVIGLVIGVLLVWIGALVLSFTISIQSTENIANLIESSILARIFYYNNPLQNFVMNIRSGLR